MTEGRLQVWRVLQEVVALLVFVVLLLSVQELLNPFLFFWILVLVLLPFRGVPGYGLLVFVAAILTVYWLLATTGFLLAPFVLGFVFAYVLDPLVDALVAHGVEYRRGTAGGGNQMRQPYLRRTLGDVDYSLYPHTEHVHFYGFYIGNYPGLDRSKIVRLCTILNALPTGDATQAEGA